MEGWYSLKVCRVRYAKLNYRRDGEKWQRLEDAYEPVQEKKLVDWNVEQLRLTTDSIIIEQPGNVYERKEGKIMQMEYRWRVIIPLTACYDIVVSEDRSDSITPIPTVRFKVREAPQSVDASEKPANRIDPTLITAEKSLEEVSTNVDANPEHRDRRAAHGEVHYDEAVNEGEHGQEGDEKREKKHTIGEDDHDKTSDASRFPLAQLFKDGDAVRGMEISLVFCRPGSASIKNKKQKYRWIWPAVIWFFGLNGTFFPCRNGVKAKEFSEKYGFKFNLNEYLITELSRSGVSTQMNWLPDGKTEWEISPRRSKLGDPSINSSGAVNQTVSQNSTGEVWGGKATTERADRSAAQWGSSEVDDVASLREKVESLESSLENAKTHWDKKRKQEVTAAQAYVDTVQKLGEVRIALERASRHFLI